MTAPSRVLAAFLIAAIATPAGPAAAQNRSFFERAPRWAVVGEHGTYNIAWITIMDSLLLPKPFYEVTVSFKPARRGVGAVPERNWREMSEVALEEIARRCPPPAQWEVAGSVRDFDPGDRPARAALRVTYRCG